MNIRNAKRTQGTGIDVEYEHPTFGWIPFTANENDVEPLGREIYALAVDIAADADPAPAPVVPRTVTMRQARLALLGAGMLDTVGAAVVNAGPAAVIAWEYSQAVERDYGLVPTLAALLGLTDAQIDALFTAAAAL